MSSDCSCACHIHPHTPCDTDGGCGHRHEDHRCERGAHCAQWEWIEIHTATGERRERTGAVINTERGLCAACHAHVATAVADLPADYVQLNQVLAKTGGGRGEPVGGTRDLPVPIRLNVQALQALIVHETSCWAESAAEVMRIDWDTDAMKHTRPAFRVGRACALLANSMTVLLALRDVTHITWNPTRWNPRAGQYGAYDPQDRDGITGGITLLGLHQRAHGLLGGARLVHKLLVPCPRCNHPSLHRENGTDRVDCHNTVCRSRYTWDHYQTLCAELAKRREAFA